MRIKHWSIAFAYLILAAFAISRLAWGGDFEANQSTNAITTSTTAGFNGAGPGDILASVLINQRGTGGETLKIYDSSATATSLIGTIDISTGSVGGLALNSNEYVYNLRVSSGITISKSGGTANVTILWKDVR